MTKAVLELGAPHWASRKLLEILCAKCGIWSKIAFCFVLGVVNQNKVQYWH